VPTGQFVDDLATQAEALVRLWDQAEDWAVPRIPPSQVKVLSLLRYRGEMNLSALATKFGAIPSSASRLCDRLEASGLVQREVPADNRREVRRRLESFDDARREDLARVLERMSAEARAALLDGLREFSTAAQEARDASA
jgi:DNA-binding MarR family transcriptional regulator